MALEKQLVSVDFTGGLDTKTDAKLVLSGRLTRLENGAFREKDIGKRYGSADLPTVTTDGGALASPTGLATFQSQLLVQDNDLLRAYVTGLQKWSGALPGSSSSTPLIATTERKPLVRNNRSQDGGCDGAILNGIGVYAWSELISGAFKVHYAIIDESSGAVLVQDGEISGTFSGPGIPRVLALDARYVGIVWGEGAGVELATVDTQSPTGANWPGSLASDLGTNGRFDVATVSNGGLVLLYSSTGDATLKAAYWSPSTLPGTLTATSTVSASTGTVGTRGLSLTVDSHDNLIALVYDNAATVARAYAFTFVAGLLTSAGNVSLGTATAFDNSCGLAVSAVAGDARLFWADGTDLYTAKLNWSASSHDASPTLFLRNAVLATTPIEVDGQLLVGAVYQPPNSPTLDGEYTGFVLAYDTSGIGTAGGANVAARVLPGLCQPQTALPHWAHTVGIRLPGPISLSSTSAAFLFSERGRLVTGDRTDGVGRTSAFDQTPLGLTRIDFARSSLADVGSARLGDLLFVPGARPLYFDGAALEEAGFHLYPDQLVSGTDTGAVIAAGTYFYTAVYNWVDAQGQLHRSAPAPSLQVVASGSTSITITAPCLQMTNKPGVAVEFYRTTAGGTVFYRLDSVSVPNYAPKDTATVLYTDHTTDTALVSGEALYTTGGVLESIAAPPCSMVCNHRERLFVAGGEDPYEVRFTAPRVVGQAPRFNEDFSLRVPSQTGKVTGLASLDEKLILFAERAIYVVLGDGPDALGQGGTFSDPQALPADSGCVTSRSVVVTPDGVMFQAERGLSLLGHDLSVSYVGAEVDDFNDYTIRSAVAVPGQNQVRFQADTGSDISNGIALVYDYLFRQWGTFPTYGGLDAALWSGVYVRARSDGKVRQETVGSFLEAGAAYSVLAECAWLKPAGLQGFQRAYRMLVLGDCKSAPATFAISVGYDYDSAYASADQASFSGSLTTGKPFQVRIHLRKQKCEAIRFLLSETPGGGSNEGISLSNLMLEVGIRRGSYKLPSGQTVKQTG